MTSGVTVYSQGMAVTGGLTINSGGFVSGAGGVTISSGRYASEVLKNE